MGLCKCPKRKVTNLFCFEHRVNVCESCLLANHESCVVQTYLSWLTDSDYDANCLLCFEPLISKETVRLKCLHLFHWNCFDARMRQLPDTTAPAGYKCPSCLECIFPSENQQSPVVDKLRIKLQTVNWGRLGIGLPTLPELDQKTPSGHLNASSGMAEMMGGDNHILQNHIDRSQHATMPILPPVSIPSTMPNHQDPFIINESRFTARSKLLSESSNGGGSMASSVFIGNEDDSKYMKKAQSERSFRSRLSRLPRSVKRLLLALLALALLYVLVGMLIGSPGDANNDIGLKQQNGEDGRGDPLFDPHANPNVRVQAGGAGRGES